MRAGTTQETWDIELPAGANALMRLLPPALVGLFYLLKHYEFVPLDLLISAPAERPNLAKMAEAWQFLGLMVPALYLSSIGPVGLVSSGKGFLLRMLPGEPALARNRMIIAWAGILWLGVFLFFAWRLIDFPASQDSSMFLRLLMFTLMHVGLMSGVGVFTFLAALPEAPAPTETWEGGNRTDLPKEGAGKQ